jgi:hypothetical protein
MDTLNEAWSWVVSWHWGWQTFAGLLIFSWVAQAYDYFDKTDNADIVIDMKVGAINGFAKVLNGIASLLTVLAPFIFLASILYWLDL